MTQMREQRKLKQQRRCVGCMTSYPQSSLIRMTMKNNRLEIDDDDRAEGRGLYLCRNIDCLERAIRRNSFSRACRCSIDKDSIDILRNEFKERIKEEANV